MDPLQCFLWPWDTDPRETYTEGSTSWWSDLPSSGQRKSMSGHSSAEFSRLFQNDNQRVVLFSGLSYTFTCSNIETSVVSQRGCELLLKLLTEWVWNSHSAGFALGTAI